MNTRLNIILSLLVSWTLLLGCQEQDPRGKLAPHESLKFIVSMPTNDLELRTAAVNISGSKNFNIVWKQGDKIRLFCEQKGKAYDLGEVSVVNISEDGRGGEFSIRPSKEIDRDKPFALYGVHGVPAGYSVEQGIYFDISPIVGIPLEQFIAPLHFRLEITPNHKYDRIELQHLGSYEFVHLKNVAAHTIEVVAPHLSTATDQDLLWYYDAASNASVYYNPETRKIHNGTLISQRKPHQATAIAPEITKTFVSWYHSTESLLPSLHLWAHIDAKERVSNARKSTKMNTLVLGKGYHVMALWDGEQLVLGELEPLALELTAVELAVGGARELNVTEGKALRLENDREDIASATLLDGGKKLRLEGKSEGTANIKVLNATHYIPLQVTVHKQKEPEENPADPNIPWEEISSDDYELSSDGLALIRWKNDKTKHLDMNRDPRLKKVTSIGKEAFRLFRSLMSINIPNSVTSIGESAFWSCSNLTSINIPSSVTSIGARAFWSCSNLMSINIPSSVTSIGEAAFSYSSLMSINIPNSVTSIGEAAFSRSSLKSINIPSSVTSIEKRVFSGCNYLKSINIPSSVTSIGAGAFSDCNSLTSINIPSSVTSIGAGAFSRSRLKSINIPSSVTSIGAEAFSLCLSLTSINIPSSVTSIEKETFSRCIYLTSINIPSSVTSIGESAFWDCSSLTNINIPSSVTSI
ncbi:MAG: leucine-rich repeat protein, partial [Porphyromonadaceae bacterium]|nr:leucine-rich repeat protein [Porphyromonadaceae bacterium]